MATSALFNRDSQLENSFEVCGAAIDSSPLPMAIVEGSNHLLRSVNLPFCFLLGKSKEQLLGNPWSNVIPAGESFLYHLDRVLATGENYIQAAGSNRVRSAFLAYATWPVLNSSGSPIGAVIQITETGLSAAATVAVQRNLLLDSQHQKHIAEGLSEELRNERSEHGKALQALVQSEKLASLGRLAASIAHEINNPLEAVTNVVYLVRTAPNLPAEIRQYLDMADAELSRIAHITRQTLGFYRESQSATTFPATALVEAVCHLLASKIKARRAAIDWQVDPRLQITAHFGELRQIFSNLVSNSLDAIENGGIIRFRITSRKDTNYGGSQVRMTISDNGAGISAKTLSQIFEPFFSTKGSAGNGLGLWVSREIVLKHGGLIQVRSRTQGPHRGTTFSVSLPQAES